MISLDESLRKYVYNIVPWTVISLIIVKNHLERPQWIFTASEGSFRWNKPQIAVKTPGGPLKALQEQVFPWNIIDSS